MAEVQRLGSSLGENYFNVLVRFSDGFADDTTGRLAKKTEEKMELRKKKSDKVSIVLSLLVHLQR